MFKIGLSQPFWVFTYFHFFLPFLHIWTLTTDCSDFGGLVLNKIDWIPLSLEFISW